MKILHLTLTRHWFDEIASGRKTVEYRHNKPYWRRRLMIEPREPGDLRNFDEVHFKNGYAKDAPFMRVECGIIDQGIGHYGQNDFRIHLGKVLEIKNWKEAQ